MCPNMKGILLGSVAVILIINFVAGNHRGDVCQDNLSCPDTGLTCTSGKCYCYMDVSEDVAKFWACNDDQDCPAVKNQENDLQSGVDREKDSERAIPALGTPQKILKCYPSTECPVVPGYTGYCNVGRQHGETEDD